MNKNTSMVLIAAVAGIMVAATLAVTMTSAAFADPRNKDNDHKSDITATGGNGGIGGAGGAGGVAFGGSSGSGNGNHNGGGDANGGDGGDANGGNVCLVRCNAGN